MPFGVATIALVSVKLSIVVINSLSDIDCCIAFNRLYSCSTPASISGDNVAIVAENFVARKLSYCVIHSIK